MGFLENKRVLIVGIASNRSIAAGIAAAMHREGAKLALSYQNDKLKERVEDMGKDWGCELYLPLDVNDDAQISDTFTQIKQKMGGLDCIVHSVAYAPPEQLDGDYVNAINREGFKIAHEISSYSLGALAKAGAPLLKQSGGSIVTMSYLGAERAIPNYNVMGVAKASLEANVRYLAYSLGPDQIRVNAISAGPIRTLAASGIKNFRKLLSQNEAMTPLRSNTTQEQVGNTAAFLCSDLASGITGEVIHVDSGFHIVAMGGVE